MEREDVNDPELQIEILEAVYLIALQVNKMHFMQKKRRQPCSVKCTCLQTSYMLLCLSFLSFRTIT